MAPNPYFTNTFATYIEVNGKKYYLNSSRVTLKPDDKIKLKNLLCCNGGDKGDILVAVYAYDGTNFHQVAGGSKTLNPDACMTELDLDRSEFYARELCMFNKDIEIVVISFYWDGSSWVQDDWLCYDSNCGFKVKVETKCCDWLCTSHAKLFKVKVIDKDTKQPIQGATVKVCFDCGGYCSTTSPGYESHTTDSNGEVWIEKCAPGLFDPSCLAIVAEKSGYTCVTSALIKNWSDISDCDVYEFELEKATLINITITVLNSKTAQPVEKAKVELYLSGYPPTLVDTQYTDSYGKVEFKDLDIYKFYYVEITKDCYKKYTSAKFNPTNKTFKITEYKHCFKVEVIDFQTSKPIQDAKVELYDDKENFIASDTTDSSGLTDLFVTDKDPIILKITKSGYTEFNGTIQGGVGVNGETITHYLFKEGKGDIEVTVIDVGGNPINEFTAYYKKKTEELYYIGCAPSGETNKCTIKDLPYGDYDIMAHNPDYGDATSNVTHYSSKTSVTITLGAPSGKCKVKFRVYSREGGAVIYTLTPLENVSVTLECKDIGYEKTLKTNKDGEADFGEIDLRDEKRTFHYKIYYNEYWQTYESTRTFTQGHSYDIEIHMERCSELIPGWQRMIMSWLGIQTENLKCDEAESLLQQFTTYLLIGAAIFLFLFLLSLLD